MVDLERGTLNDERLIYLANLNLAGKHKMASIIRDEPHHDCRKSELMYDPPRLFQNEIESDYYQYLTPKNTLTTGNPLMFEIEGSSDAVDLTSTQLKLRIKLVEANGGALSATSKVAPINNILHSLFSQVTVSLKDNIITQSNSNYPYRAYLETLLNYSSGAKKTWLKSAGWEVDDFGKFDDESNTGLAKRRKALEDGGVLELKGRLHTDICFQPRLIPSGLDIRFTLNQSSPQFCVQSFVATKSYKIEIVEATMCVRRVKLTPECQLSVERSLAKKPARLPITYCTLKSCSVSNGLTAYSQDGLYSGILPSLVIMGMVSNDAYSGSYATNPFNFKNYDLNSLVLTVNGRSIPSKPLTPNFSAGHVLECYETLFHALGCGYEDWENDITLEQYINGFTLFAFNLAADNCPHNNSSVSGTVDISLRFRTALSETVSVVFYAQYENSIFIDQHRNVVTDIST